jgi:hypothetical protein
VEVNGTLVVVAAGAKAATLVAECQRNSHGNNTFQKLFIVIVVLSYGVVVCITIVIDLFVHHPFFAYF